MNAIPRILVGVSLLLLAGCTTRTPVNQGQSGRRMDPTHDSPAELGTRDLGSQDLVSATDKMAQDIASRPEINNPESPPIIVLAQIENRTSSPHQNYQVFLARLRAELNASGVRHGLRFVRNADDMEKFRSREYQGKDPDSSAQAYTSRADYTLTCEIHDFPSGGTNYFLLDFQLVQMRDAVSGPDHGRGAIVWENMYEVKFQ